MALSRRVEITAPDLTVTGYDFLRTEIHTGLTMAALADASKANPAKMKRNQTNARKAYDTARRFMNQIPLVPERYIEVREGLKKLRRVLQKLGEDL
ncbi:MAG: hypothetical protein DMG90_19365 [Acidobacteria bacterium]|jgi:hypothetical protein|nr:MAG: hypothetical protein DMG91_10345 [Acidobacteriota bacterium]PYV86978.1 MAG: hypothetical protein DMG90_19365 [Acidobacteriota bacterium]